MKRFAAAFVAVFTLSAVFALSGCAVTGQPANPGTAATYNGATITTAQLAAWGAAQRDLGFTAQDGEGVGYDPGAVLTLLMLRPALEAQAAKEGIVFGDEQILAEAQGWMAANGADVIAPTSEMVDVVRLVRIVHALLVTEGGMEAIRVAVESIEADAQVSPLYGTFTLGAFGMSVDTLAAQQRTDSQVLGSVNYLVFRNLSGFDASAQSDWMVDAGIGGGAPSPSPAP